MSQPTCSSRVYLAMGRRLRRAIARSDYTAAAYYDADQYARAGRLFKRLVESERRPVNMGRERPECWRCNA